MDSTNNKSLSPVYRALAIKRTLGTYTAARYLYLRGWPIGATIALLCGVGCDGGDYVS